MHEYEPLRQARSHKQKRRDELRRRRSINPNDGGLIHRRGSQARGVQNER